MDDESRKTADERTYGATERARKENRDRQVKNVIFAIAIFLILLGFASCVARNLNLGAGMDSVRDRIACANANGNPENRACQRLVEKEASQVDDFDDPTAGYEYGHTP